MNRAAMGTVDAWFDLTCPLIGGAATITEGIFIGSDHKATHPRRGPGWLRQGSDQCSGGEKSQKAFSQDHNRFFGLTDILHQSDRETIA